MQVALSDVSNFTDCFTLGRPFHKGVIPLLLITKPAMAVTVWHLLASTVMSVLASLCSLMFSTGKKPLYCQCANSHMTYKYKMVSGTSPTAGVH